MSMISKIILLVAGAILLIGGGYCAATNAYYLASSPDNPFAVIFIVLLVTSLVIAISGITLIVISGIGKYFRHSARSQPVAPDDTPRK